MRWLFVHIVLEIAYRKQPWTRTVQGGFPDALSSAQNLTVLTMNNNRMRWGTT